eukprot:TRINITY_DN10667_c0_g1_i16.p1 TRINITY_DN10667_c0_g1~~TRINITY_DN10667_c0_g1_i16.p1  ORF type:complete len:139 (-),score=44.88 TRINITY_DN10667_c0_g1_i16:19-435(-)
MGKVKERVDAMEDGEFEGIKKSIVKSLNAKETLSGQCQRKYLSLKVLREDQEEPWWTINEDLASWVSDYDKSDLLELIDEKLLSHQRRSRLSIQMFSTNKEDAYFNLRNALDDQKIYYTKDLQDLLSDITKDKTEDDD